jgi:Zn-dependent M28 family amino/carboxypeptidase
MLLGSRHYAQMLQETDGTGEIEAIVNVDMAGCNAPTWVNFTDDDRDFKLRVARVFERLGIFERYGDVHWQCPPWPTGDHAPFVDAGLPALYVSHRGQRYPHLHLPSDTVDKVDPEVLELAVNYLRAIVDGLVE